MDSQFFPERILVRGGWEPGSSGALLNTTRSCTILFGGAFPRLPSSFLDSLKLHPPPVPIDLEKAHEQHRRYVETLRQAAPQAQIIDIEADPAFPDCVFIEDTAFTVRLGPSDPISAPSASNSAPQVCVVVTRPGAPERRGEVDAVRTALASLSGIALLEISEPGTMDGGDVLVMGRDVYIGETRRTNAAGIEQARALLAPHGVAVHRVPVPSSGTDVLHLKSVVSQLDERTLVVTSGSAGEGVRREIEAIGAATGVGPYKFVVVHSSLASNVVRLATSVLVQDTPECRAEWPALQEACSERRLDFVPTCLGENAKADGALTCCSLLV